MILFFQNQTREESDTVVIDRLLAKGWQEQPAAPAVSEGENPVWNHETQEWEAVPALPMPAIWQPYNFLLRFTAEERGAMIEEARTNANLEDFRSLCAAAPAIEADHAVTIAGMNYLVALNILTEERKTQILDPNHEP